MHPRSLMPSPRPSTRMISTPRLSGSPSSRGVATAGLDIRSCAAPTLVVSARAYAGPPEEQLRGLRIRIVRVPLARGVGAAPHEDGELPRLPSSPSITRASRATTRRFSWIAPVASSRARAATCSSCAQADSSPPPVRLGILPGHRARDDRRVGASHAVFRDRPVRSACELSKMRTRRLSRTPSGAFSRSQK